MTHEKFAGKYRSYSLAQSFLAALKMYAGNAPYSSTKPHVNRDVLHYLEGFYNSHRPLSASDYHWHAEVNYGGLRLATATDNKPT